MPGEWEIDGEVSDEQNVSTAATLSEQSRTSGSETSSWRLDGRRLEHNLYDVTADGSWVNSVRRCGRSSDATIATARIVSITPSGTSTGIL